MTETDSIIDDIESLNEKEESDFSKVVDILLNDDYKRRKTILSNRQVTKLTTIDVISQIYDVPFLKAWVNYYAEWRTSGDGGKGRKDIVEISKFQYGKDYDWDSDRMLRKMRR